jgi:phosphoribosylglycinamide formyltransferase 1
MPPATIAAVSLRLAVLISGSGSTLRNILERIADRRLTNVEMVGVAASRECQGLQYAQQYGVPHAVVPRIVGEGEFAAQDFSARLTRQLDEWQPDLIALGGFLSLYLFPEQYSGRIINVHPALLPAFGGAGMYGDRVHEAVLASGTKVTGCSAHIVSDEYDGGPIIAQRTVAVLDGDTPETLGARVREAERELYPNVIQWFADGRVKLVDGQVEVNPRELGRMNDER